MPDDNAGLSTTRQGFTSTGLAAFNQGFHDLVDQRQLAGVVTLVARHGETVNLEAYGKLDASPPARRCGRTRSSASPR